MSWSSSVCTLVLLRTSKSSVSKSESSNSSGVCNGTTERGKHSKKRVNEERSKDQRKRQEERQQEKDKNKKKGVLCTDKKTPCSVMSCLCILKHKLKLQAGAKHIGSKKLQSHLLLLSVERQGRSCGLLERFYQLWSFTSSLAQNAKQVTSTTSKILIFKQISISTGHAQSKAQYRLTEKCIWLRHVHRKDDVDR